MTDTTGSDQPPQRIISLEVAMRKAAEDEFWEIRGKAVQAYANLEQSLCSLFGALAGVTTWEIGAIIFFRIANSHARNRIIEQLFKKKFGDRFNLFRNSLLADLTPIDQERNEIVHWNVVNIVGTDEAGETTARVVLKPPAQAWALV
jgi:hypothetical protein